MARRRHPRALRNHGRLEDANRIGPLNMSEAIYKSTRGDKAHARIYDAHMKHPAWKNLSGNAFKLLCATLAAYRPGQNNFPMGGNTVAAMIGVSEKTGKKIADELIATGHFREERRGKNVGQLNTRERVISLTRHDTETNTGDPDLPVKIWRQKMQTQKYLPNEPGKKSGSEKRRKGLNGNNGGADVIPLKKADTRM